MKILKTGLSLTSGGYESEFLCVKDALGISNFSLVKCENFTCEKHIANVGYRTNVRHLKILTCERHIVNVKCENLTCERQIANVRYRTNEGHLEILPRERHIVNVKCENLTCKRQIANVRYRTNEGSLEIFMRERHFENLTCKRHIANVGEQQFAVWNWLDLLAHCEQPLLHTILRIFLE